MNPPGKEPISKSTVSFGWAVAIASLANALLVIAKEKVPAVQAAMRHLTGSHWVTHVVIILALFIAVGFVGSKFASGNQVNRLVALILAGVGLAGVIITGFYVVFG